MSQNAREYRPQALALRVITTSDLPAVVAILRRGLGLPIGTIANAVRSCAPLLLAPEWAACLPADAERVLSLVQELTKAGAQVQVLLDQEGVSLDFLQNQVETKRGIADDIDRSHDSQGT